MKIDLGRKYDAPEVAAPKKGEKSYPYLSIEKESNDFPVYKSGEKVKAVVELEVQSSEYHERDGKKTHRCNFDVHSIEFMGNKKQPHIQDTIEDALKEQLKNKET